MSWPNDTYLNRCENSKTVICNLSRISPPHDQSAAYYSGHTAFTLWHFSSVRLYANAFSQTSRTMHHIFCKYICIMCRCSVWMQFTHFLASRGAHIYSIKWPLMAFSRCGALNRSKYSTTSKTEYPCWFINFIIDEDSNHIAGLNIPSVWLVLQLIYSPSSPN